MNFSRWLFVFFVGLAHGYNIHDYGWKPHVPGGLTFTQFGGGTDGPNYQYEATFKRDCGLGCTEYARASDFETLDSRHVFYDHDRSYGSDLYLDYDRSYG